jgi:pullulanase/glycogen debranching enzyme
MRDGLRGGGPFDSGASFVSNQGFASGLCYDANASATCPAGQPQYGQDLVRIGMAGSLATYLLGGKAASTYNYGGQPAGYTASPVESVNYAAVHDGETLWDIQQYKLPTATTSADRARAQVVALAPVLLGEGIPFVHAGDEILRSKGMDHNSYNSGDWFNRIDWSAGTNYFGAMGLPVASDNQASWPAMTPILQNANTVPTSADIIFAREAVKDLLRVRRSTTMFRLGTAAAVMNCVSFPDEASQVAGFLMMVVGKAGTSCGDNAWKSVIVAINAKPVAQSYVVAAYAGHATVTLHPVQVAGADAVVKTASFQASNGNFSIPARTAAVFVEP